MRDSEPAAMRLTERFRTKPVLRAVYTDLYRDIRDALAPGLAVEIGGGAGLFKQFAPEVINSDIVPAPGLDVVADAQQLPFAAASVTNIIAFDVLHHLEYPVMFFREAERVLVEGGRIILVEPGITPLSLIFYRMLHEEPVQFGVDPWRTGRPDPARNPYKGNQAVPTLMLVHQKHKFHEVFRRLTIHRISWKSLWVYPLSGGYQAWSMLPAFAAQPLLCLERALLPIIGRIAAFRLLVVIEVGQG